MVGRYMPGPRLHPHAQKYWKGHVVISNKFLLILILGIIFCISPSPSALGNGGRHHREGGGEPDLTTLRDGTLIDKPLARSYLLVVTAPG